MHEALNPKQSASWIRLLQVLVACTSGFVALLFVVTALKRLHYPYELEELEGYIFVSALRVFHGQSVYPPPSLQFIPYMYPPGYYYAVVAMGKLMGMTMATLRLTSILSTLGGFAVIFLLVQREVKRWLPALAAVGLYAGCYTVCAEWFDLGRLDSFFILLVLIAMYATRHWHPVVAAICWTLTFQTKQSILPAAFVMLCCNWKEVRRTLAGAVTFALGAGASVAYFNHATRGWYSFYVFQVPKANADLKLRTAALFWPADLFRPLSIALLLIAAAFLLTRPSLAGRATRFYLAACSMIPLFWWIRTHAGSTSNALMPVYALLAVLFGIAFGRLLPWTRTLEQRLAPTALIVLLLAVFSQEAAGIYNPGDYLPHADVRQSLDHLVADLRTMPGRPLVAQHPYYAWLAGKPMQADLVSLSDAMHGASPALRTLLQQDVQAALDRHDYSAILLNDQATSEKIDLLLGHSAALPDRPEAWRTWYGIEEAAPGTEPGTMPSWLMLHCAAGATTPCP